MPLYRRAGSPHWWVRLSVGGRRVRESTRTSDRAKAEALEAALHDRVWREVQLGQIVRTWAQAAERWKTETASKRSADKDARMLRWFGEVKEFADLELADITPDVIAAARAKLREGLSENTVNKYLALVRSILRKAHHEWGWLAALPKVPMYRIRPPDPRWLTRPQFALLVAELPEHTADMARIAVMTGLRRSNITGLTWDRVDLKRRTAFIPATLAKGAAGISVPLSPEAVTVLKRWQGRHPTHVFCYTADREDAKPAPVTQVATAAWRKAVKRAGIGEGFRFHDLRHTWASWQVQSETPLSILKELGGWASFSMVQRYSHLSPGHLRQYAGKIGPRRAPKRRSSAR